MAHVFDQSSPEATAAGVRCCLMKRDWKRAFRYMTIDMQAGMVGGMLMSIFYAVDGYPEEIRESLGPILARHGIIEKGSVIPRESDVLLAIFTDLEKWCRKHLADVKEMDFAASAEEGEYSEYRISGEWAYAINTHRGRRGSARFQRIEGVWFLTTA